MEDSLVAQVGTIGAHAKRLLLALVQIIQGPASRAYCVWPIWDIYLHDCDMFPAEREESTSVVQHLCAYTAKLVLCDLKGIFLRTFPCYLFQELRVTGLCAG